MRLRCHGPGRSQRRRASLLRIGRSYRECFRGRSLQRQAQTPRAALPVWRTACPPCYPPCYPSQVI
jgi:hypothetical protein